FLLSLPHLASGLASLVLSK
uniref:Phylloseptin Bu-2 n=1 Tax=Phyllomedusa burmeisteri TaxID=39413 RepID=PLS2_PHYBU|nr:RecName: Full=Phylloseptin Bu-2; Short=PLS-Bu2 [Phyllomedusa burmeisteri]